MDLDPTAIAVAVITGIFGLSAAIYGYRASKRATREQTAIDRRRLEAEIVDGLIAKLQDELARQGERIQRCEQKAQEQDERISEQREQLAELQQRLADSVRRYKGAVKYVRTLLRFIGEHVPGKPPPAPPEELIVDVDG